MPWVLTQHPGRTVGSQGALDQVADSRCCDVDLIFGHTHAPKARAHGRLARPSGIGPLFDTVGDDAFHGLVKHVADERGLQVTNAGDGIRLQDLLAGLERAAFSR